MKKQLIKYKDMFWIYKAVWESKLIVVVFDYILRKTDGDYDKAFELLFIKLMASYFNLTVRWRGKQFRKELYANLLATRSANEIALHCSVNI
jgi:hypothetical protein